MTIVLAALESDACAQPVLNTAIALAELFDGTAVAMHVRENGPGSPQAQAAAAAVELRETAGDAIEEIVAAAREPDVAALVLGARGVHGGRANPMSPPSCSVPAVCMEARGRPDIRRSKSSRE